MDDASDYLRSRMRTGRPQRSDVPVQGGHRSAQPVHPVGSQSAVTDQASWVAFPNGLASERPVAYASVPVASSTQSPAQQLRPESEVRAIASQTSRQQIANVQSVQPAPTRQSSMPLQQVSRSNPTAQQQVIQSAPQPARQAVQSRMTPTSQLTTYGVQTASAADPRTVYPAMQVSDNVMPATGNVQLLQTPALTVPARSAPTSASTYSQAVAETFWEASAPNPVHEQTLTDVLGYAVSDNRLDQLVDIRPKKRGLRRLAKAMAFMATAASMFAVGIGISFLQGRPQAQNTQQPSTEQVLGAQTTQSASQQGQGSSTTISLGAADSGGLADSLQPYTQANATPENGYTRSEGTYKNAKLTISKQPLPDSLRGDEQAFVSVAQQLGATTKLTTKKWGTVYLATVQAQQVQVLIMKSTSQMVVVQSDRVLSATDWPAYVESL